MHKSEYTPRVFTFSSPAIKFLVEKGVKSVQSWQKHQNDLIGMKKTWANIYEIYGDFRFMSIISL